VLDPPALASILGARQLPLHPRVLRAAAAGSWRLRLQPSEPGWVDMGLSVPLMDTTRAREELGWEPRHGADDALRELLAGLQGGEGLDTPPLVPGNAGRLRAREFLTGVGKRAA
jgi:UDP-glucose 4-epimerase